MSDILHIDVEVFEERLTHNDKVIAVGARTNITVPVNGCYSVPKLERLKEKIDKVLRDNLPDCLLHEGGGRRELENGLDGEAHDGV